VVILWMTAIMAPWSKLDRVSMTLGDANGDL